MNPKICFLIPALLLFPAAVFAGKAEGPKARTMAKYDLNHDGKIDADETAALQKDFAASPKGELAHFDANHDGKLSPEEIAKIIPGSGKKSAKGNKTPAAKNDDPATAGTKAPDENK